MGQVSRLALFRTPWKTDLTQLYPVGLYIYTAVIIIGGTNGVTMGWLLRLVTVLEFLVINFKLTFGSFSLVVFHILFRHQLRYTASGTGCAHLYCSQYCITVSTLLCHKRAHSKEIRSVLYYSAAPFTRCLNRSAPSSAWDTWTTSPLAALRGQSQRTSRQ